MLFKLFLKIFPKGAYLGKSINHDKVLDLTTADPFRFAQHQALRSQANVVCGCYQHPCVSLPQWRPSVSCWCYSGDLFHTPTVPFLPPSFPHQPFARSSALTHPLALGVKGEVGCFRHHEPDWAGVALLSWSRMATVLSPTAVLSSSDTWLSSQALLWVMTDILTMGLLSSLSTTTLLKKIHVRLSLKLQGNLQQDSKVAFCIFASSYTWYGC